MHRANGLNGSQKGWSVVHAHRGSASGTNAMILQAIAVERFREIPTSMSLPAVLKGLYPRVSAPEMGSGCSGNGHVRFRGRHQNPPAAELGRRCCQTPTSLRPIQPGGSPFSEEALLRLESQSTLHHRESCVGPLEDVQC